MPVLAGGPCPRPVPGPQSPPALAGERPVGGDSIHVAGSQNGWERPSQDDGQELLLSRRTKFCLRVPKDRLEEVRRELTGATLDVAGHPLTLGAAKIKPLAKDPTLFARYVAIQDYQDEDRFLTWAVRELGRRWRAGAQGPVRQNPLPVHAPGAVGGA